MVLGCAGSRAVGSNCSGNMANKWRNHGPAVDCGSLLLGMLVQANQPLSWLRREDDREHPASEVAIPGLSFYFLLLACVGVAVATDVPLKDYLTPTFFYFIALLLYARLFVALNSSKFHSMDADLLYAASPFS